MLEQLYGIRPCNDFFTAPKLEGFPGGRETEEGSQYNSEFYLILNLKGFGYSFVRH